MALPTNEPHLRIPCKTEAAGCEEGRGGGGGGAENGAKMSGPGG